MRLCTDKDNGRCYPAARIIKWPACRERNRVPKKMFEDEGGDNEGREYYKYTFVGYH